MGCADEMARSASGDPGDLNLVGADTINEKVSGWKAGEEGEICGRVERENALCREAGLERLPGECGLKDRDGKAV